MTIVISKTRPSAGAFTLRRALASAGVRAVVSDRRSFNKSKVINWGDSSSLSAPRVFNAPEKVAVSCNKIAAFRVLGELTAVNIPKWWTDEATAKAERVGTVLERHSLTGHSGKGIVVRERGEELQRAPLYVQYIQKEREYRVHVVNGKAIAVQQKRKAEGLGYENNRIRSHQNGYVYCVNAVVEDGLEGVKAMAEAAVNGLGLDFGAADMIVGRKDNKPYVLEVNTAPGLSSPVILAAYAQAFKEVMGG